jgi:hypothetical protein
MAAYPHDHGTWALIGLYRGREDNTFYRRSPEGLQVAGGKQLETGDTGLLGKSVIHAVVNPLPVFTGAIRIYGGDFFGTPRSDWDPETLQERAYDNERARKGFEDANERGSPNARGPAENDSDGPHAGRAMSAESSAAWYAMIISALDAVDPTGCDRTWTRSFSRWW